MYFIYSCFISCMRKMSLIAFYIGIGAKNRAAKRPVVSLYRGDLMGRVYGDWLFQHLRQNGVGHIKDGH